MIYPAAYQQAMLAAATDVHRVRLTPAEGVSLEALQEALHQLAERTEILRTSVHNKHEQTVQEVGRDQTFNIYADGPALQLELPAACFDVGALDALVQSIDATRSPADPEALQYSDFSSWQKGNETDEDAAETRGYWQAYRKQLPQQASLTQLTAQRPCGALASLEVALPDIREAQLLCAYAQVLAFQQARSDVVIDVCIEGRAAPELQELLGPLRAYAPIVIDTTKQTSELEPLIQQTRDAHEAAIDCYDERADFDHRPRFLFERRERTSRGTLLTATYEAGPQPACELRVIHESGSTLYLESDWYSPAGLRVFADQLVRVATELTQSEHPTTKALDGLASQAAFNPHLAATDTNTSLTDLFAHAVAHHGDREAVACSAKRLTYRALGDAVSQAAAAFESHGVSPGDTVGLMLDRSTDLILLQLAAMHLGAAFLPLDPEYPDRRLAHMIDDSGCKLVVTTSAEAAKLGTATLKSVEEIVSFHAEQTPDRIATGSHTAYVIYTSGSTGKPKGVRVGQASVANALESMSQQLALRADDRILSLTTPSFDISIVELFVGLTQGACTVIAPSELRLDPGGLDAFLVREAITVAQATPSSWRLLTNSGWNGKPDLRVFCGGEPLAQDLADALTERCGEVWNMYGPTEATIWCTRAKLNPDTRVTIGTPLDHAQLWVLDNDLQPIEIGGTGEICVTGTCLAQGYHARPELTEERFVTNHNLPVSTRVYRTGDLGRWRADGTLECLGRIDQQIKLHGHRIELGEIECCAREHADVSDAAAAVTTQGSAESLSLFYTADQDIDPTALIAHLGNALPTWMLPSRAVRVESLPRTPAGKLDRAALANLQAAFTIAPPQGPVETLLTLLFRELLPDAPEFGATQSFFEVGGDSLLAVQFCNTMSELAQEHVSVVSIFDHPTARAYAAFAEASLPAFVEVLEEESPEDIAELFAQADIPEQTLWQDNRYPLSYNQRRTWRIDSSCNRTPAFNTVLAVTFPAEASLDGLMQAMQHAVGRYALLNSRFTEGPAGPETRVSTSADSHLFLQEPWPEGIPAETLVAEVASYRFDLENEPPVRCTLHLGSNRTLMVVVLHQIAADAACRQILIDECTRVLQDQTPQPLDHRYWDAVAWRAEAMPEEERLALSSDFAQYVEGTAPILDLKTDRNQPAPDQAGGTLSIEIDAELDRRVGAFAAEHHVSWAMVYQSACFLVLHRWSSSRDFVVGTTVGNRELEPLHDIFGRLANMLMVRARVPANATAVEFLTDVRTSTIESLRFSHLPMASQVDAYAWQQAEGRNLGYQVMFAVEEDPHLPAPWLELGAHCVPIRKNTAKYDLTFLIADRDQRHLELEYDSGLFDRSTAERIANDFAIALAGLVEGNNGMLAPIVDALSGP